jgi:two-component system, NarL family, sensor kinase
MQGNKIFWILLLFISVNAFSQQKDIDSIQNLLKRNLSIPERALKMKDLAMFYETVDTSKSNIFYNQAIAFARKNKLDYETGVIYQNKSYLNTSAGHYDEAIKNLDSALIFASESKHENRVYFTGKVYSVMSVNYRYLNDYKKSVDYLLKAIAVFEKLNKYTNLVSCYYNLGNSYKELDEFEKQKECGEKALFYANKTGEKKDFFVANLMIAFAYTMMNQYKEAKIYINETKKYYDENNAFESLLSFHLISGQINMNLNELDEANSNFTESLKIAQKWKHTFSIIQSKMQLGRVLTLQKKFVEAEKVFKEAETNIAKTKENSQNDILLDYISRLYEESGNYEKALHYYKSYKQLKDSITSVENKEYISSLETKFQVHKKESQILVQTAQLKQRRIIIGILIISLIGMLLTTFIYLRYFKQKQIIQQQRINQLETEKSLTATASVLKGEEQERTRLAKDLHDGLGGMLSGIKYSLNNMKGNLIMTHENAQAFERSIDMLDSSIKEMRRVAHNMMPEALVRYGLDTALKDFCFDINQSGIMKISYQSYGMVNIEIEQTKSITIYRIVQELINNALKHSGAKEILVQLSLTNHVLSVTVEDDGKGFDISTLDDVKGIGWKNIKNRVEFLQANLDIHSEVDKGTSILIEINV